MKDINHSEIQKMLYQIESQLPLIIVNELDVIRTQLQYKALVSKSGDQNDLNITLVVSGYFKDESSWWLCEKQINHEINNIDCVTGDDFY